MQNHVVLNTIRDLKKHTGDDFSLFNDLLSHAHTLETDDKNFTKALEHFQTVDMKEKDNLIHLMYNKKYVNKNPWNDFLRETRSIVVNWKTEQIILYPFSKFFELDEVKESKKSKVIERLKNAHSTVYTLKIDGSLITSRYLKEQGEVMTVSSGSFDSLHVEQANRLIHSSNWHELMKKHPYLSFIFEMKLKTFPQNIFYGVDELVLIGARNMDTFEMLNHSQLSSLVSNTDLKLVDTFDFHFEDIVNQIESPHFDHEGYILDIDGWKVKLKSKNFILGARISTDESRTFNTLDIALSENRFEQVINLTNIRYRENFSSLKDFVSNFIKKRKEFFDSFEQEHHFESLDKREKATILNNFKSNFANYYFALGFVNNENSLSAEEKKFLKNYAKFFNTYNHERFAKTFDMTVEEVLSKISNGDIVFEESYKSPRGTVYMINTKQFFDEGIYQNIFINYLNQL